MRTDGQTDMTKLIVAFRNFADAPKNRRYSPRFMHFFARLYNFLPLLRDIFRNAVQLPCNLNLNSRRGLETPAFAGKFDFGEEKIGPGGWGGGWGEVR
jgi:hypothetical protein